jgi:hypothetical protein
MYMTTLKVSKTTTNKSNRSAPQASFEIERVQLGVKMEKRMVKVLKALAEYHNKTFSDLLEDIVLHQFEPVKGQEGRMCASALSKDSYEVLKDLKRVYRMDYDTHASYRFKEVKPSSG